MTGYSVLIVEDDAPVRNAIRFVLVEAGHQVLEAPDGMAGLGMLRQASQPLVVVLDLMTPQMTGIELLQTVGREPDIARRTAFVITSAARAFTIPDLAKYLHGGYLTVVPKPFDLDELASCVEEAAHHLGARADG